MPAARRLLPTAGTYSCGSITPPLLLCCPLTPLDCPFTLLADPRQQKQKKRKPSKQELLAQVQEKQAASTELAATQEGKVGGQGAGGAGSSRQRWQRCLRTMHSGAMGRRGCYHVADSATIWYTVVEALHCCQHLHQAHADSAWHGCPFLCPT